MQRPKPMITCLECGTPNVPNLGRGLCCHCYNHLYRVGVLDQEYPKQRGTRFTCPACRREATLWGYGVCYACYMATYRSDEPVADAPENGRQISAADAWGIVWRTLADFLGGTDGHTDAKAARTAFRTETAAII